MKEKISEDEVFEAYKNGLPEDFSLKGKKIRRKPIDTKKSSVRISMKVEYDLLKEIKEQALIHQLPYQTFMKRIIRDYLEHNSFEERLKKIERKIYRLEAQAQAQAS